jgi:hypothetical protein
MFTQQFYEDAKARNPGLRLASECLGFNYGYILERARNAPALTALRR